MSVNLYVISTQDFTGKSAVCVALLRRLQTDGYKIGYLKPFSSAARLIAESRIDEDARFVKQTFDLPEPIEELAPVVFSNHNLRVHLTSNQREDYSKIITDAARRVEQGRDVVVMEGSANFREGYVVDLAPSKMVELLDAQVVAVVGYRHSLQVVDDALTAQTRLGDRLKGIIINIVPDNRTVYIHELVKPYLEQRGIKTLAVLPHKSVLSSLSVGEVNDALEGNVICYGCYNDLVENLVVASMGVEHSLEQFRRVKNKAVIVGADRPDIQMDALDTSTKALILTGGMDPAPQVVDRAEVDDVAIIMSSFDTLTTIEKMEQLFDRSRFTQIEKVRHFEDMLNSAMDFDQFYQDIGLR